MDRVVNRQFPDIEAMSAAATQSAIQYLCELNNNNHNNNNHVALCICMLHNSSQYETMGRTRLAVGERNSNFVGDKYATADLRICVSSLREMR